MNGLAAAVLMLFAVAAILVVLASLVDILTTVNAAFEVVH